jgi:hypothetical protein
MIISNAKALWNVLANPVASDIIAESQSYPLNFSQLEEKDTRPNAPVANGYSTKYSETINCRQKNEDHSTTSTLQSVPKQRIERAYEVIGNPRSNFLFQRLTARAEHGVAGRKRHREAAPDTEHQVHSAAASEGGATDQG